jgi:hypothetical protein
MFLAFSCIQLSSLRQGTADVGSLTKGSTVLAKAAIHGHPLVPCGNPSNGNDAIVSPRREEWLACFAMFGWWSQIIYGELE